MFRDMIRLITIDILEKNASDSNSFSKISPYLLNDPHIYK